MKKYISSIKVISEYEKDLERQNLWWTVVAMVGKVNSQGLEPQLLDSISETQKQFDELKANLIESLVKRYVERVNIDLTLKAQSFIDILNRNLFERTADVGFLSTDSALISYLNAQDYTANARQSIELLLTEYVNKYTVYSDVVLLTPEMEVIAQIDKNNPVSHSTESVYQLALESQDYIEYDQTIDVCASEKIPLHFIQRVEHKGQVIGLLSMSFKLEDELQRIQTTLVDKYNHLTFSLIGEKSQILFSSGKPLAGVLVNNESNHLFEFNEDGQACFGILTRTSGYQGYKGLNWRSFVYIKVLDGLNHSYQSYYENSKLDRNSSLFPDDLYELNLLINTALLIVILNGKISSLKNKIKSFLPVLDSFQEIGTEIKEVFSSSIEHIHLVLHNTMQERALLAANVALDVMDRNLYERANDCRWWALTASFKAFLSKEQNENQAVIDDVLQRINSLYTVYTLLYLYDRNGHIVAVSNPKNQSVIGRDLSDLDEVKQCLKLTTTQEYSVSSFTKSPLYDNRATYQYHAPVFGEKTSKVIGGVGVVFDSEPEFKAILDDFLPKNVDKTPLEGAFALYLGHNNLVISVTDNNFNLIAGVPLSESMIDENDLVSDKESFDLKLNGINYIVARQLSSGYREYKNDDGYQNPIQCFVFIKS